MKIHKRIQRFGICVAAVVLIAGAGGCGREDKTDSVRNKRWKTTAVQQEETTEAAAQPTEPVPTEQPTDMSQAEQKTDVPQDAQPTDMPQAERTVGGSPYDFTVCFAGDINLDENWATTQYLNQCPNGIYDCISPELIEEMNAADVMCLNNEFTYSNRGTPLPGKAYTFRANPDRVHVLEQLGVDIVKMANNHVYDYGADALMDTFATLDSAGIPYIGAGRTLAEAMRPYYFELDGKRVAFVAASRAEKNRMTPQATGSAPGILRCYDTALFKQVIAEAHANADFVIAYVHWGTEYSYELESVQRTTGREYLDCGADIVIGAHTHCLQGMEYYNGKPIVYSLGNYWFNNKTLDTMLLKLHFHGDGMNEQLDVQVIPAVQAGCRTQIAVDGAERERIFAFLEGISAGVDITPEGYVRAVP